LAIVKSRLALVGVQESRRAPRMARYFTSQMGCQFSHHANIG
jgi:hypothetical protein